MPIRWVFPEDVARQVEKAEKTMETLDASDAKEAISSLLTLLNRAERTRCTLVITIKALSSEKPKRPPLPSFKYENESHDEISENDEMYVFESVDDETTNGTTKKLYPKAPSLNMSNVTESINNLKIFLKLAKIPKNNIRNTLLGFVAPNNIALIANATNEELENPEKFIKFLETNLGFQSKRELQNNYEALNQETNEALPVLLNRVVSNYKNLYEKKILNQTDKSMIVSKAIEAIQDRELRNQLRKADINFENFVSKSTQIRNALDKEKEEAQKISNLNTHELASIQITPNEKNAEQPTRCNKCGLFHLPRQCVASKKIIRNFNRRTNNFNPRFNFNRGRGQMRPYTNNTYQSYRPQFQPPRYQVSRGRPRFFNTRMVNRPRFANRSFGQARPRYQRMYFHEDFRQNTYQDDYKEEENYTENEKTTEDDDYMPYENEQQFEEMYTLN